MRQRYQILTYPAQEQLADHTEVEGKFIQFTWRGVAYLVFATRSEHRFHNQILAHFLTDHDLPHHWRNDETLSIEAEGVTIIGGGRFRYERRRNRLELWDNSQAYGRFNEVGLEAGIHAAVHPWSLARVVIQDNGAAD